MKVQVLQRGGLDRKAEAEQIVRFAAKKLMSTRMANTLKIRIELRASKLKASTHGQVTKHTAGEFDWRNKKSHRVTVQRDLDLGGFDMIETIAHEMVHIEQFATGRLRKRYLVTEKVWKSYWNSVEVNLPYRDQPWEIEARKKAEIIKLQYLIEVMGKLGISNIADCVPVWQKRLAELQAADQPKEVVA